MTHTVPEPSTGSQFPHFMLKEIYQQPETIRRMSKHWVDPSGGFIVPAGFPSRQELRGLAKGYRSQPVDPAGMQARWQVHAEETGGDFGGSGFRQS